LLKILSPCDVQKYHNQDGAAVAGAARHPQATRPLEFFILDKHRAIHGY
jgi:hypothetical protein